uniref:Prepilin peptidase n=1 Tax=candidate division CPR3 bacterium TaxID=2268181 RepID=A0A7C4R535_UNCC3
MIYYYSILIFIFGIIIGSFLSVVIGRLETGEPITFGRSQCPKCKKNIKYYDLVPLLSFVFLKGRCRDCQKKISLFYPFIELVTGILFVALFWRFWSGYFDSDFVLFFIIHLFILSSWVVVFFYDWFYTIIPDKVVLPAILITFIIGVLNLILKPINGIDIFIYNNNSIVPFILGIVIGGGFFLSLVLISREKWMGWGDVKLGLLLGLVLGFPNILMALFFAFIIGSIYSLFMIGAKKKKIKDIIPFGPFMVMGGIITLFLGKWIWLWYLAV